MRSVYTYVSLDTANPMEWVDMSNAAKPSDWVISYAVDRLESQVSTQCREIVFSDGPPQHLMEATVTIASVV